MHLNAARIAPLTSDGADAAGQTWLKSYKERGNPIFNIHRTLARHPRLAEAFVGWAAYVGRGSTLSPRDRELLVLRMLWNYRAGYEWALHAKYAHLATISEDDIARLRSGPDAEGWTDAERALIRAADELRAHGFISDPTWTQLAVGRDEQACLDVLCTAAQYAQIAMIVNSLGTPLDRGVTIDDTTLAAWQSDI